MRCSPLRPVLVLTLAMSLLAVGVVHAQDDAAASAPDKMFLQFIRQQAAALRANDESPKSREQWEQRRVALRKQLEASWGGFPAEPCPLEPRVLGTIERDGYRIEKVVFQTLPGVWMTANAYVPAKPAQHKPAVLCVHGHWRLAKQEPVVQMRCIGLARLGFFVLAVDAFGAGERAVGKALGEYHGEMTAATLFPAGLTLSGLQVYENRRAVDYLQSRSEVNPDRIAITGASGGGNQSMYAGVFDERLRAAIPVCSVGNYQAYLGAACCMCEVVPNALRYTDEGDLLGLAAPRALMVINATGDAPQFSVAEARKSLARAADIFRLYDRADSVRHTIIESGHDYNQPMREAMYGWVLKHLAEMGDGSPMAEPPLMTEDPESLRCFPGDSRPDDYLTLPRFAARHARSLLAAHEPPSDSAQRKAWIEQRRTLLRDKLLGGWPAESPLRLTHESKADGVNRLTYESEPGVQLETWGIAARDARGVAVLLAADLPEKTLASKQAQKWLADGWNVVAPELRATGRTAVKGDAIGQAPDHNSAEWSLWIGRPLVGQWVWDVKRALAAVEQSTGGGKEPVIVVGLPSVGPLPWFVGALDDRPQRVECDGALETYVSDVPYRGQRLAWLVPGLLRDVGDIPHLKLLGP
ncbi:MAG: alpha/beta hydrolase family protein [Pirellulales bacterium]